MQLEYSGSFDYYKKKIEQLEENNKVQIENTNRYTKDIQALEEQHKKQIKDLEEKYDHINEAQKIAHENEIQESKTKSPTVS